MNEGARMTDIDNMPAGAEMDELIAQRVFGWSWYPITWNGQQRVLAPDLATADTITAGDHCRTSFLLPWSTNITHAWSVAEQMRICVEPVSLGWHAYSNARGVDLSTSSYGAAPHAICKAALKAVMG